MGITVIMLGMMIGTLSILARVIGVGTNNYFGPTRAAGSTLAALNILGGVWIQVKSPRNS